MTDKNSGVSRRTLAKGAAWAVPAVAVAAAAPAHAASVKVPPPPVITFGGACGNTGAQQKGCGGGKTLQVPLTLTNQTGAAVVFQITSMFTCNCSTAPTAPGAGVYAGVRGVWETPTHTVEDHNDCTATTQSTCTGGVTDGSVLVPDKTIAKTYWIESVELRSSSTFSTTINWRMLLASDCTVLSSGQAQTASAISPANCGSATTATTTEAEADAAAKTDADAAATKAEADAAATKAEADAAATTTEADAATTTEADAAATKAEADAAAATTTEADAAAAKAEEDAAAAGSAG